MPVEASWISRYRRLLLWASGWLLVAAVVYLVARSSLPDPVAIHWGLDGAANGSAPQWAIPVTALGTLLVGLALTPIFTVSREPAMESFAVVGMSGGLAVAIVGVTVYANHGVAVWSDADEVGLGAVVALLVVPVLGLIAGIILGRHWYPLKVVDRRSGKGEVIDVEAGERVSWVGRSRVKGLTLVMFGVAVLLILLFPDLPLWLFVLIVGLGLVFSQVEAQVADDGVRVRLGGIPVRRIPLERISSARMIDVVPAEFGGWGWRAVPGKTAIVLRSGEAIALTLSSGREFVITVDDAGIGAGLVNGLIERAARP